MFAPGAAATMAEQAPACSPQGSGMVGPLVGGIIGFAGALVAVWWKGNMDRAAQVRAESREHRHVVYRKLVSTLAGGTDAYTETLSVSEALVAFGSDDVVRAWTVYIDALNRKLDMSSAEGRALWSGVLLAIRRDASDVDTQLTTTDLRAAFLIAPVTSSPASGVETRKDSKG
jgi:gas vesicle protein